MAKKQKPGTPGRKIPAVRIARPEGRPFQLRYTDPVDKREVRISVGSRDEDEAARMKAELEAKLLLGLNTKPGKEKEVADFLRSAVPLVSAEVATISWFAIQEGPSSFAIFDTFDDEAGRDAHLNGKVAAALMEKVKSGELFAKAPEIHKIEILADKLPR